MATSPIRVYGLRATEVSRAMEKRFDPDSGLMGAPEAEALHELARLQCENERLRLRCNELEGRVRMQRAERIGAVVRTAVAA
jgi:hypothetical protein